MNFFESENRKRQSNRPRFWSAFFAWPVCAWRCRGPRPACLTRCQIVHLLLSVASYHILRTRKNLTSFGVLLRKQVALKQGVAVEHSAHLLRLRGGGKAAAAVKAEPKAGRSVASVLHAIVNARTATAFVILGEPCHSLLCRSHLLKELRSPRFHPTQRPEARPLNAASLPRMAPVPLVTRRRLAHFRGLRPPTPALRQGRALLTRRASARRPVQPPCSRSSGRTRRRRTLPPPRHL